AGSVFAYTMAMGGKIFSASLANFEFVPSATGTDLIFTEQGAYFEGSVGLKMREDGWRKHFENLSKELGARHPCAPTEPKSIAFCRESAIPRAARCSKDSAGGRCPSRTWQNRSRSHWRQSFSTCKSSKKADWYILRRSEGSGHAVSNLRGSRLRNNGSRRGAP